MTTLAALEAMMRQHWKGVVASDGSDIRSKGKKVMGGNCGEFPWVLGEAGGERRRCFDLVADQTQRAQLEEREDKSPRCHVSRMKAVEYEQRS